MFFYNHNILYKFCFLFFFIFKKKKLGFKKVQWKLSSFFHSKRIKYFFYFIKKLFLYKKYFFYFFIIQNLNYMIFQLCKYYNLLLLKKNNLFFNTYFPALEDRSLFSNIFSFNVNNKNVNFDYFYFFYFSFFIKFFFIMFKHINISYFALPIKRNKYTILRSPHIDKKSREQFELKHLFFVVNELSMFSFSENNNLFNLFKFFISNCKIDERTIKIAK